MKKKLLILYLISTNFLFCKVELNPIIISIPKCGSHLIRKCVELITKGKVIPNFHHARYSKLKWVKHQGYNKIFFMYRDPRDQIISLIFHVKERIEEAKGNNEKLNKIKDLLIYRDLKIQDIIDKLIFEGSKYYNFYSDVTYKTYGIKHFYDDFLGWKNEKDVCVIKFEDLIGSKGGGNDNSQFNSIKKIAAHLSIKLSNKEIKEVANNLFGAETFFRKGQIGDWKNYFDQKNIYNFKQYAGSLLINWGYEKDLNW